MKLDHNPEKGYVRFDVEVDPHDGAVNGHEWQAGHLPAAEVARTLREIADRIEREWAEPIECVCDAGRR